MFSSQSRPVGIVLAMLLLAAGSYFWIAKPPLLGAASPKDSRVKALLKERLVILKEIVEHTAKDFERGDVKVAELHAAKEAVFKAELDLAESPEERITIHKKFLAEAKQHEQHTARFARSQPLDFLKAKAHRLEAEIALEREIRKVSDK